MADNILDSGLNVVGSSTGLKVTLPQSIEIEGTTNNYFVLASPDGTRFKISVGNTGTISATSSGTF